MRITVARDFLAERDRVDIGVDPSEVDELSVALDHSWNWFALHAAQRMQLVNYLLVAVALFVNAYATLLKDHEYSPAVVVATSGAISVLGFNRLDRRTRELVRIGEAALSAIEDRLAVATATPSLRLVQTADSSTLKFARYKIIINGLEWLIVGGFVGAAMYAFYQ